MGDAELGKCPTDLGEFLLVNLALTLAGEKVMPTTIGVERTKQALRRDRLGQAKKARHRAFFFDQESRINSASRIVHRYNEIEIVPERSNPAMLRGILEHSIPGKGRRTRFLRCAPRRFAFGTSPAACNESLVTV